MTKLYLRDQTAPSGTPTSEQSSALPAGTATGSTATHALSTTAGSNSNAFHNWSNTADTVHRDYPLYIFAWALPTTDSIAANTWTIAVAAIEGNAAANACFSFSLYVYRPGTGVVGTRIYDAHSTPTAGTVFAEWSTTNNGHLGTVSGGAVSGIQSGDLLVLEVWAHATPSMAVAYGQSVYYDGANDVQDGVHDISAASFISTPQNLEGAPASQDLTGSVFSRAPTFASATVTKLYALSGSTFSRAGTFAAAAITVGAVSLSGSTFARAPSFGAGTIGTTGGTQNLTGSTFSRAGTFAAAAITKLYALSGTKLSRAPTFPTGTVARGAVSLAGSVFARAGTFPSGTIARGAVSLAGSTFARAPTFASGTVARGAVSLSGSTLARAPSFPAGVVSAEGGPQPLGGTTFARAPTFGAGIVGRGAVSLSASTFVRVPSFAGGAIGRGLFGTTFARAPTFGAGTLSGSAVELVGIVLERAPAFAGGLIYSGGLGAPVIVPGSIRRGDGSGSVERGDGSGEIRRAQG